MNSFLTIEDINSCLINAFDYSGIYKCDTSKIGIDGEYEDINYDFIEVSHSISGGNHTFNFKVKNVGWTGDYYIMVDGVVVNTDASLSIDTITFTTTSDNVILCLYISYLKKGKHGFNFNRLTIVPLDFEPMFIDEEVVYRFKNITSTTKNILSNYDFTSEYDSETKIYTLTYNPVSNPPNEILEFYLNQNTPLFCFNVLKKKPTIKFLHEYEGLTRIVDYIIPGNSNHYVHFVLDTVIPLNPKINQPKFYYKDTELKYSFDGNRLYTVYIDLSEHRTLSPIKINVKIRETGDYLGVDENILFYPKFEEVNTFNQLVTETNYGTSFIDINNDMSFSKKIYIKGTVSINGKNNVFDLNNHSIILNEDATLNLKNVTLINGNKAIVQSKNSKLIIENVNFENNYTENIGSCISCKVDVENINENDDYTTFIKDCNFINNNSCISHYGNLVVTDCEYENNDINYANKNFPAFLYQNNGEADIRGSSFDITYDVDDYCSNMMNIGFGQALIHIGTSAIVNNQNQENILKENRLNLFNNPYNNQSHVLCKYYYSKIESCVYSSPEPSFEEKCVCYSLSGSNWIYKQNVQVTKPDGENRIRRN